MSNLLKNSSEDLISTLPIDSSTNLSEEQKKKIAEDVSVTESIFLPKNPSKEEEGTFLNKKTKSVALAIIIYVILNTPIIRSYTSKYLKSEIINKVFTIVLSAVIAYLYYSQL